MRVSHQNQCGSVLEPKPMLESSPTEVFPPLLFLLAFTPIRLERLEFRDESIER